MSFFSLTPIICDLLFVVLSLVSIVLAGASINLGASFQALGKSHFSTIVSFCRQIIVLLPVAYFLSKTGVLNNVWLAFPVAEVMSLIVSLICFRYVYKTLIVKLDEKI